MVYLEFFSTAHSTFHRSLSIKVRPVWKSMILKNPLLTSVYRLNKISLFAQQISKKSWNYHLILFISNPYWLKVRLYPACSSARPLECGFPTLIQKKFKSTDCSKTSAGPLFRNSGISEEELCFAHASPYHDTSWDHLTLVDGCLLLLSCLSNKLMGEVYTPTVWWFISANISWLHLYDWHQTF